MRSRSPTSTYDELERAVIDMRERFLSIGEHIAGLLASLAHHIDTAPAQARASIRRAAEQIAGTQQRLRAQMANLPARPEERYQIMSSLLQAQHGALQQLTIIVAQHTPHAALPHQAATAYANNYAHIPASDVDYDWLTVPRGAAMAGQSLADAHFGRPMQGADHMPPARTRPARRAPQRRRAGAMLLGIMSSRMLVVVSAIVAVAVVAYLYLPGANDQRELSRPMTFSRGDEAATDPATPMRRLARPQIGAEEPSGDAQPARIRPLPDSGGVEQAQPGTATRLPDPLSPTFGTPRPQYPGFGEEQVAVTMPKPSTAVAEGDAAPAEPAPPRFVAVVFTHRESAAALDAFAGLQQRYPAVLARRKAEAQPIEIADKGTWHRLVVLPAGSRQSASGLCDKLQAAGYDKCWVKAY